MIIIFFKWNIIYDSSGPQCVEIFFLPVSKVLDVYAALACVEYLEPQNLDTDVQRQTWLRLVKKLQVPIELVCSEDSVRDYGDRSMMMVKRVQ